jgi:hypothetical protein
MRIEIESAMRKAAREGCDGYVPVFGDLSLQIEGSTPDVSLNNLRVLLKSGLKVASVTVVEGGHVLAAFVTGETYLALGFAVGRHASELTLNFSQFMHSAFPRLSPSDWEGILTTFFDDNHMGVIDHQSYIDLKIKETGGIKLFDQR